MKSSDGQKRAGAAIAALASLLLVAGCVAPLIAGVAAGGGVFGVNAGMDALQKREMAKDSRLRYVTGASLGISSERVATITDKDWRKDILYWTATLESGESYKCESSTGTAHCVPADRDSKQPR